MLYEHLKQTVPSYKGHSVFRDGRLIAFHNEDDEEEIERLHREIEAFEDKEIVITRKAVPAERENVTFETEFQIAVTEE